MTYCNRCHYLVIEVPETGEQICSGCGMVIAERSESLAKPHNLSPERHSREELEAVLHHGSPNTLLQWAPLGNLPESTQVNGRKLFVNDSYMAKLRRGIEYIRILGEKLKLPNSVLERAAFLFRHAKAGGIRTQTSVIVIVAVWLACKENHRACDLKEMAQLLGLKHSVPSSRSRTIYELCAFWKIKPPNDDPESLIYSWCYSLHLPKQIMERALEINQLTKGKFHSRSPYLLASSCIWFAASEGLPDKSRIQILSSKDLEEVSRRSIQTIAPMVKLLKREVAFQPRYTPESATRRMRKYHSILRKAMNEFTERINPIENVQCQHCPLEIKTMASVYSCKCGFKGACRFCIYEHMSEVKYHHNSTTETMRLDR